MSYIIIKGNSKLAPLRSQSGEGEIPFDVTFKIFGDDNSTIAKHDPNVDCREIMAHKLILASFSPVFKKMFYGVLKEPNDIINVEQTTADAFSLLMDYFYQVDISCEGMTILELFDLVNLAERYDVPELMNKLTEQMKLLPITMENIMEVAIIASNFSEFEAASSALMLNCAKYFQEKVKKYHDLLKFISAQHKKGNGAVALSLLSLVESLPPLECFNCHEKKCLRGSLVTPFKLVEGLKVQVNKDSNYWGRGAGGGQWANVHYTAVDVNSQALTFKLRDESGYVIGHPYHLTPYGVGGGVTLIFDC